MPEDSGARYRLCLAEQELVRLRALAERANRLGLGTEYVEVLKTIREKLTADPLGWGDPQYRLRHLGLLLCRGIHSFLQVYYAVDEERRLVYVKQCQPLPGHPLAEGI